MKRRVTLDELWEVDREIRNKIRAEDTGHERYYLFRDGLEAVSLMLLGSEPPRSNEPLSTQDLSTDECLDRLYSPSTPLNAVPFGAADGDGVHYVSLTVGSRELCDCPVVKVCPGWGGMDDYIVVGEDLYEFLCLGCRCGYDLIPGAAESSLYEMMVAENQHMNVPLDDWPYAFAEHRRRVLEYLGNRLQLEPWVDLRGRLGELEVEYLSLIQIPPEA